MAEIKPFRAWRYNIDLSKNIDKLTSPLFDVVSEKQRHNLYKNPYNSIHISVPLGEDPAANASKTLNKWKSEGIIVQDPIPGIYVYYQYFTLAGTHKEFCRKGFIANIKAYDWDENVVLRHENTIPQSVNDRIDLLAATELNVSPTHGLYTDPDFELDYIMDEAIKHPLYDSEDYQGVRDVLGVIHDATLIRKFIKVLEDKQIILADGHHRYEGSLAYKKYRMEQEPDNSGNEGYHYHLMFFSNTDSKDLRILPTHRLVQKFKNFDKEFFLDKVSEYFTIKNVDNINDLTEIILGKKWAFGLILNNEAYKIRLKPEVLGQLTWNFPELIKERDLTVLHFFIFEKILGIKGKDQRTTEHINYTRDFMECYTKVITNEAQLAIITQDLSMDEIKEVCYSGYLLPQKSTYFYPKIICGFLFSSIKQDEFQSIPYSCF
ncbi:DUF1015 domain-containing protein [soil metagenome]